MTVDGNRVHLRGFIEGVEVPINAANVQESLWAVSRCNLSIPYKPSGDQLYPRSLVHVFYREQNDVWFERQDIIEGADPTSSIRRRHDDYTASGAGAYHLLFWGESTGIGQDMSASQQALQIMCQGFSNYFDSIQQLQALRGRGTMSDMERRYAGIEEPLSTGSSGRYSTADRVTQILREGGENTQEGIVELVNEFIAGTNEFYRDRKTILRIQDMLRLLENDDTSERLMDLSVFRRFMRQTVGRQGQYTIRKLLEILGQYLFHDFVEHAGPTHFPYVTRETAAALAEDRIDENTPVVDREGQVDLMTSLVFKPQLWWTTPPACNILFPNQYSKITYGRNEIEEPTRTILKVHPAMSGSRRTIVDNYFAPDLTELNTLASAEEVSDQEVFQLPHEKFKGIIYNVVMLGELARLVGRDSANEYLRSYAQFTHWTAAYGRRSAQVRSMRHLPQVLVGYPALAIDPKVVRHSDPPHDEHLEERLLLRRELAALRRCLRRLLRRLAALRSRLARVIDQRYYIRWLQRVKEFMQISTVGPSATELSTMLDEGTLNLEDPTDWDRWDLDATYRRQYISLSDSEAQAAAAEHLEADDSVVLSRIDRELLREILDAHLADLVVPNADNRILLNPWDRRYDTRLLVILAQLREEIERLESAISSTRANIARVRAAMRALREHLLTLGVDVGQYNHKLFYVQRKDTSISKGQVTTTISGSFTRSHDEDIDYDGSRGDSFEYIIKTGPGGFFSDNYAPDRIGDEFYSKLYGVPSLVDVGVELQPLTEHGDSDLDDELYTEADGEIPIWRQVLLEVCERDFDSVSAAEGFSTADAIDVLIQFYKGLGSNVAEIERFVTQTTSRPIATMVEVLGAQVLRDDPLQGALRYGNFRGSQVNSGVGFHEFAFLSEDEEFDMSGVEGPELDQKYASTQRRDRVVSYVQELGDLDWTQ